MRYYKYNNKQLEATSRIIISPNVVEITKEEFNTLVLEIEKQHREEAYTNYVSNGGSLSKEEWLNQTDKVI